MNNLISNLQKTTPENLKNDLKTNLENALKSVKILDPKNLSKQADAIESKLKQVDSIKPEDTQALKSLQRLATESSLLIEDVPNTTDNILQTQITNILTRSIPDMNKLILDLQNKQVTDVTTLNSRLSSINDSLTKSITEVTNTFNQNITDIQTSITSLRNDNNRRFNDISTLINTNISVLTNAVSSLSNLVSSDINALYSAFNNMKNIVETQKIVINTPQNKRWTIAGDSDGKLCIGNPNPLTCINNDGDLVVPANMTTELNNVINVPPLPVVKY